MKFLSSRAPLITAVLLTLLLASWLLASGATVLLAQEQSSQRTASNAQTEPRKENREQTKDAGSEHKSMAGELAEETRESTGEDQEEYSNLKHASAIQWMARKTGLSIHQAHLVALFINFAIIVAVVLWAARKYVPPMLQARNASIQKSLEEARTASQDANRRLSDIENRLRQLDVEIGQMQANAEKEGDAEDGRIQKATEEDIRKVVQSAEQEIAAAAKQVRRELAAHTAELAISLASKEIRIDSNTDEMLVRSFASTLASNDARNQSRQDQGKQDQGGNGRGKDGR